MKMQLLVLVAVLGMSAGALACPACKDQIPSQKTADGKMLVDPVATQRGFALSIYLLLLSVYGLPCTVGFLVWRSVRAAQARKRRLRESARAGSRAPPAAPGAREERETGLPAINWGPAREEAGS